jgi:DNA polymerase III delta prime subunit
MNISFFEEKPLLSDLDFPCEILEKYATVDVHDMNNFIVYGLPSSGKTTKVYAFLASLFDKRVYDLKNNIFEEDRKTIVYKASIFHIEVDCIQIANNDRFFIQNFIKSYSESKNIGLDIPKIIYFKNANHLSDQSQMTMRKIVEKGSNTAKFIFEINNISSFLSALISRCLLIKIRVPSMVDMHNCIKKMHSKQNIEYDEKLMTAIIEECNKTSQTMNLKKIFGYLQYKRVSNQPFVFLYHSQMEELIQLIVNKKQSFVLLKKVRDSINEMHINLVSMNELLLYLYNRLCSIYKENDEMLYSLLEMTVETDVEMKKGNKLCIHLEHYVIAIIDLLHGK